MKIITNPDVKFSNDLKKQIKENDGYCLCAVVRTDDTKCMCTEFRNQNTSGYCHCGLYYKDMEDKND